MSDGERKTESVDNATVNGEEWIDITDKPTLMGESYDEEITFSNCDGEFFDYIDGLLQFEFTTVKVGDIFFEFRIKEDIIIRTPTRTSPFGLGKPRRSSPQDLVFFAYSSFSLCSFCHEMISWLEAVVCGVRECSFYWEGEGPEGELSWNRNGDSGLLRIFWSGSQKTDETSLWFAPAFEHRVSLNKRKMVSAFYQGFLDFLESDRYDPNEYKDDYGDAEAMPQRSSLIERWLNSGKSDPSV